MAQKNSKGFFSSKPILLSIVVFCLTAICFGLLIFKVQKADTQATRDKVSYLTDSMVRKLQASLDIYLNNTEIWEILIMETKDPIENFDEIAAKLYENDPAVRSIQLAPNGVVSKVFPLKGNEEAYGDLFADPDRRTEAEYARDSGKMTLAGPFMLYQGGMGIVARNPVYLPNENGEPQFWGFTIIVLNVPEIFASADLGRMREEGYEYKLWRIHPDTQEVQIIDESSKEALPNPTEFLIEVPNSTWSFGMAPIGGWVNAKNLAFQIALAILLSSLLGLITWMLFHLNEQKNQMMALSYMDSLTTLYNARKCLEMLHDYQDRSQPFGIIYLDLNKFKLVNDQYGHDIGNELLIAVGAQLKKSIHKTDTPFRIGGDEFLVLISGQYPKDFYHERIALLKQSIEQEIMIGDLALHTSACAGFARFPDDDTSFEILIQKADAAMYEEKSHINAL